MDTAPQLAPIDKAPGLGVRLFFYLCRRLLGKVMMPARVIYPRMPRLLLPQMLMYRLAARGLSLPPLLVHRVHVRVSLRNGCAFCTDIHRAVAVREGFSFDQLTEAEDATAALQLNPAHRTALDYVDELCANGHASEASFAALRVHFDERQIVELAWLYAFTSYLNRLAGAFRIGSDGFCALLPAATGPRDGERAPSLRCEDRG